MTSNDTVPNQAGSMPMKSHLFNIMRQDFGDRGTYSCAMFEIGERFLEQAEDNSLMAYPAAYCFRQALVEIFKEEGEPVLWRDVSRKVVKTKKHVKDLWHPTRSELEEVYETIDKLDEIHQLDRTHEMRVGAIIKDRTGQEPLRDSNSILHSYQNTIDKLNTLVHIIPKSGRDDVTDVSNCYREAISILHTILISSERKNKIVKLAELYNPSDEDAKRLRECLISPNDFEWFAQNIRDPAWFKKLDSKILEPTEGSPWLILYIVQHLKGEHTDAFIEIVMENVPNWIQIDTGFKGLCQVAFKLGDKGLPLMMRLLGKNLESPYLCNYAALLYSNVSPSNQWIVKIADVLLKPNSGLQNFHEEILSKLVDGIEPYSAKKRIEVVAYKIKHYVDLNQYFPIHQYGNLSQQRQTFPCIKHGFVAHLCDALLKSSELGIPTMDLIEWIRPLPNILKLRFVAWLYSKTRDVDCSVLTDFIVDAIDTRSPTGDDLLLLDRLMKDCDMVVLAERLANAIGVAPELEEISAMQELPRRVQWAIGMRGDIELPGWENILGVLKRRGITHDSMSVPIARTFARSTSPFDPKDFDTTDPYDLANKIASWRPDTRDELMFLSSTDICRELENNVKSDPIKWIKDPIKIIKLLRHPTYVAGYFRGLTNTDKPLDANAALLVRAIQLSCAHPWPVTPLSSSLLEYDSNWHSVDFEGMSLINTLIKKNITLNDESISSVWEAIYAVATNDEYEEISSSSEFDTSRDLLTDALNDPRTCAIETLINFIAYGKQRNRSIPTKALVVLARALDLNGWSGAKHRAIIACHTRLLRNCIPDWFKQKESLLFGSKAPENFAQISLDIHLKWEYPDEHMLHTYFNGILDAVKRDVPGSMEYILRGMFWSINGYEPASLALKIVEMGPKHTSLAGERSAIMVKTTNDSAFIQRGVDFWKCVLDLSSDPEALLGYGRWSLVRSLDQNTWESLTLQTCERTRGQFDFSWMVAERISSADEITDTGLCILTHLIKSSSNVFDSIQVKQYASDVLLKTKNMKGQQPWDSLYNTMLDRGHNLDF